VRAAADPRSDDSTLAHPKLPTRDSLGALAADDRLYSGGSRSTIRF